ncbi:DUF547 domain-containing protein [Galbibacter sp. BG1]|uniref:DUF547 domain-containing protein n=1 Tax=Galbibacter sp. BG1 TaxID=1170699 RepID=UPI0015C112E3|nr:DUF547 domain-containing protein [Galbibacter sp. BG1]QLE02864.1 DUF547 domain-containing protein [Galbibacter sp. BG1]
MKFIAIFLFIAVSCYAPSEEKKNNGAFSASEFNELSENFLLAVKEGKNTEEYQEKLANTTLEELSADLQSNDEKIAFWLNIYNAYIQVILQENPKLYEDRNSFFKKEQIEIAGKQLSFGDIEHGMIRKSQWDLGMGYIRTWFPNKFERTLRTDKRDYRIHFALNCGAKDCPPVAIYNPKELDKQLETITKRYLENTSEYNDKTKEVAVTSLFNWFRGDFGGKSGTKEILEKHGIIPQTKGIDLNYKDYDWTLKLENYISL